MDDNKDEIPSESLNVTLLPPTNANEDVTDEDSGPEDDPKIDNAPKGQLHSEVVVECANKIDFYENSTDIFEALPNVGPSCSTSEPELKTQVSPAKKLCRRRLEKIKRSYKWAHVELANTLEEFPVISSCEAEKGKSPLEYFRMLLDDEILNLLVNFTNQYAAKKNVMLNCSQDEMLVFIAVLLLSGYVSMPRKVMYWQHEEDTHNDLVSGAISRDRFQQIMSNLHACDNDNLKKSDRFSKIRCLLERLNKNFQDFSPHEQFQSIDESMVPYYGRHGAKQFIKGKIGL